MMPSERSDDASILVLSERLERLSADVTLSAESKGGFRVSFVVGRLYDRYQIVTAHRQVSILQFHARFCKSRAACIQSLSAIFNVSDSLIRPFQERNVSWHGFSFSLIRP